jgi:Uri superfamily endonuclease
MPPIDLSGAPWVAADHSEMPDEPGAYALLLTVRRTLRLDLPALGNPALPPGLYVYAGSARGPGGIRARVARHLRRDKAVHWHVDRITAFVRPSGVAAFPGGDECAIVAGLRGQATVPIPGFGSSDCRGCAAHLLRLG